MPCAPMASSISQYLPVVGRKVSFGLSLFDRRSTMTLSVCFCNSAKASLSVSVSLENLTVLGCGAWLGGGSRVKATTVKAKRAKKRHAFRSSLRCSEQGGRFGGLG